ncbi:MAG TPA: hypothetical protein VE732_09195, partial [Nitrososphaera sp.]|nr:hypothetical protein [Nitrososphaera sp.]
AIRRQLEILSIVRRGGTLRSAITNCSTRARDSFSFMFLARAHVGCCWRGPGHLQRYVAISGTHGYSYKRNAIV